MVSLISSNTGTGLALQPDASGQLQFSTGYGGTQLTLANNVLTLGSTTNVTMGSNSVMTMGDGTQWATAQSLGGRNRIINGAMQVSQRYGTNSYTPSAVGDPTAPNIVLDRYALYQTVASKFAFQQNAGSVTPAVGFSNYLGVTSLSAYSVAATDLWNLQQSIEWNNVPDLAWGTVNAKTVTLSFWVYSSLTGLFGGSVTNYNTGRGFGYTYTITAANTWQFVSVTIPGDVSGTWTYVANGGAIWCRWCLGAGSSSQGAYSSVWSASIAGGPTGQTNIAAVNGATWYLTGVQFELGIAATPFERKIYTQELANCQRYYQTFGSSDVPLSGYTDQVTITYVFPVQMRATPGLTHPYTDGTYDSAGPAAGKWSFNRAYVTNIAKSAGTITSQTQIQNAWAQIYLYGMTLASVPTGINSNTQANITFSAEL